MRSLIAVALLLSAALAVPASAQQATAAQAATAAPVPIAEQPLMPGDMLRLWVWRDTTMSGEFFVTPDGGVVLPRLGAVDVRDRRPDELKAALMAEYTRYVRHPSLSIEFLRRVRVGGEVERPGLYHVDATMTIGDAVLLAGGPNREGRSDRVELERNGRVITTNLRQPTPIAESPIQSGDLLRVPPRSWSSRNAQLLVTMGTAGLGMLTTLVVVRMTR